MGISIIIITLLFSAFFSGMEVAFISANKVYLGIEKQQDNFLSGILARLIEKPSQFIAAMLVGNTVSMVIYGFVISRIILDELDSAYILHPVFRLFLQMAAAALLITITAKFLPKVFFRIYANTIMKVFALPAYFFYRIFYYVSCFIIWMSDLILQKLFKVKGPELELAFSKIELGDYINEQMDQVENREMVDSEIQIFRNALEFSDLKARDIMTPRTELVAVEATESVAGLRALFVETGYSKILVYQDSFDDILGYVHSFDLFKKPALIADVMIPVEFVPETIYIKEVLNILTKKRKSIAVVLDEYGGTSGMISIEDIVEELFGEIEDEHDQDEELIEQQLEDGSYLFSARLDVEYINQLYKLDIPECDSYTTLGGFIVDATTEIPHNGDQIRIGHYYFTIQSATNNKIELVKLRVGE